MNDSDLTETIAQVLYDRSIAGRGRDEAPPWTAMPYEIREHWRDIARAALATVRTNDRADEWPH